MRKIENCQALDPSSQPREIPYPSNNPNNQSSFVATWVSKGKPPVATGQKHSTEPGQSLPAECQLVHCVEINPLDSDPRMPPEGLCVHIYEPIRPARLSGDRNFTLKSRT